MKARFNPLTYTAIFSVSVPTNVSKLSRNNEFLFSLSRNVEFNIHKKKKKKKKRKKKKDRSECTRVKQRVKLDCDASMKS